MIPTNLILHTNGKGHWSEWVRNVAITEMKVYSNWNELRVFFDVTTWNIDKHGLIYSDPRFIRELLNYFNEILDFDFKITIKHVSYSEQGMQGNNFVSFDVSEKFKNAWIAKKYN